MKFKKFIKRVFCWPCLKKQFIAVDYGKPLLGSSSHIPVRAYNFIVQFPVAVGMALVYPVVVISRFTFYLFRGIEIHSDKRRCEESKCTHAKLDHPIIYIWLPLIMGFGGTVLLFAALPVSCCYLLFYIVKTIYFSCPCVCCIDIYAEIKRPDDIPGVTLSPQQQQPYNTKMRAEKFAKRVFCCTYLGQQFSTIRDEDPLLMLSSHIPIRALIYWLQLPLAIVGVTGYPVLVMFRFVYYAYRSYCSVTTREIRQRQRSIYATIRTVKDKSLFTVGLLIRAIPWLIGGVLAGAVAIPISLTYLLYYCWKTILCTCPCVIILDCMKKKKQPAKESVQPPTGNTTKVPSSNDDDASDMP